MSERTIDARGMLCPKPLIMTKKGLVESQPGDHLTILLDNNTACENVLRFLKEYGTTPVCESGEGAFTIRVEAVAPVNPGLKPEEFCPLPDSPPNSRAGSPSGAKSVSETASQAKSAAGFVLVLNRQFMGSGSDELGKILMQACVNSLKEIVPTPSAILFYNGGVHLACEGSPVLAALAELEKGGAKLLVCGTCLDYFELKPKLKVGRVSNMYDIMQTIAAAGTVFAP